jgi:NADH dehydrogenase FAD-containing subunit
VAKALEGSFRVTLIDNKDYFEFTPSVLRTIVEPKHGTPIAFSLH